MLVQIRDVRGASTGFDMLVGQPLALDVVVEGDLAEGGVVPGTGEDLLFLPVRCAQGVAAGEEGARGAEAAVGSR